ncbi:ATP-binding cassette domain-containing protein [Chryseobacterium sp. Alg-005]|uniref:ATP-binding cassette domain-containing protein n=1 Tax=Chryseobacterium sp. Alg-005 TaxID=3159516 RepID=UPI0035558CD0
MSLLHVDSVTKSFGNKTILQDIYLRCETGKTIALLGRNGSGKSTLLKIIFGTEKGDSQFIRVNDKVLQNQKDRKTRISYLPQQFFLPKNIKIKHLIPLFCDARNTESLMTSDIMKPFLHKTVRQLSGGEKKIIEVLLIIYSDAEFILLDEPFYGLSPKMIYEIQKIIKQQSEVKGIIISDHHYEEVLNISDEILLLSDHYLRPIKDFKELQRYNYLPKRI